MTQHAIAEALPSRTMAPSFDPLLSSLARIVGEKYLLTAEEDRRFYSADLASEGAMVACVVQPDTAEDVARVVALCMEADRPVIPRGGGFSYTGGYVPTLADSVMIDLRRLNRVVEINEEDLYVTAEVGVTWRELYETLKARGLRTPYFGPMSGYWATIGGALSQGSFFLGSTQYGTVAESVLSLEVVLADGTLLRTGSGGGRNEASPFFRWYGPDLSGLFLSDTGAMGIKTRASLRLIPWPQHQRFASFAVESLASCVTIVSAVGRRGLASECYSWDPTFVKAVGERSGTLQDLKYLAGVVGSGSSFLRGVKDAARMALNGKRLLDGSTYLVHVTIDDVSAEGAEAKLKLVQAIAAETGAGEVDGSIPRATRGTPFTDFKNLGFAREGIRNLPTNALCPHSRTQELAAEITTFFADRKALFEANDLTWGVIVFAVGANAMCIEPLIYWKDPQYVWHDRVSERSNLAELARFDGPTREAEIVVAVRQELKDLCTRLECAHVQIGKAYRWADTRDPAALTTLRKVKQLLDPKRLMNPGSLGL